MSAFERLQSAVKKSRRPGAIFAVVALNLALGGCESRPSTSLVVRYITDIDRSRIDTLTLTVSWLDSGQAVGAQTYQLGGSAMGMPLNFPGTQVISPLAGWRAGRLLHLDAVLTLRGQAMPYVHIRTDVGLPAQSTRVVDLFFADLCGSSGTSARCGANESCVLRNGAATCEPTRQIQEPPVYDPSDVVAADATVDGPIDGGLPRVDSPQWFPWHGAAVSNGNITFRWDRALAMGTAKVQLKAGGNCMGAETLLAGSMGAATVPSLPPGTYCWRVQRDDGMPLTAYRIVHVRDLHRSLTEPATVLGTYFWLDRSDGEMDYAAGAPTARGGGAVQVFTAFRSRPTIQAPVEASVERFGASLANAGDMRAEGISLLAVGSPSPAQMPAMRSPVFLFGLSNGSVSSAPLATIESVDGDRAGYAMAGTGDMDGDGRSELLVGAPGANNGAGEVRIYRISADGMNPTLTTDAAPEGTVGYGSSLASGCDFDGDGYADYAVGALPSVGGRMGRPQVRVIFGGPPGESRQAVSVIPMSAFDVGSFGQAIACGGDLNEDGLPELVVGDPTAQAEGQLSGYVGVYSISRTRVVAPPRLVIGPPQTAGWGAAISVFRDSNGDSVDELAIAVEGLRVVRFYAIASRAAMIGQYRIDLPSAGRTISRGSLETSDALIPDLLVGAPDGAGTLFRTNIFPGGMSSSSADTSLMGGFGSSVLQ